MSFVGDAIGSVVGGITGASQQADAASEAANLQAAQAQIAIDEQRRQFDAITELMAPYVSAGTQALQAQQDLLGLGGAEQQTAALEALQESPQFQALTQQGEEALLANASATGGLRGGNIQGALAQFRPQILSQLINQQVGQLGGLSGLGQASAARQAAAGQQSASNVGNLLTQQGQALAGGALAQGNVTRQAFGDALNIGSALLSGGVF